MVREGKRPSQAPRATYSAAPDASLTDVSDDPVRAAARLVVAAWDVSSRGANTERIRYSAPALIACIERLGEALVPPRARMHPGMELRRDAVEAGDVIRFDYPPRDLRAKGLNGVWAVDESRIDVSRPERGYWRLHLWRLGRREGVTLEQASMDEHGSETVVWLGQLSDFPDGIPT